MYVITRYTVHICDIYNFAQWNNKGTIIYYIDFFFEISVITIEVLHYLHMLVCQVLPIFWVFDNTNNIIHVFLKIYGNFYLSMASIVICMELKRLFFDLKRRMKRHSNYLRVIEKMERRFPWATEAELVDSDKCAVCWETLDRARRLPCSHIFHQYFIFFQLTKYFFYPSILIEI
jgi:autocrine motility factor receptor